MADALPPPTFPLDIQPLQWTRVPALTTKLLSLIEALGPDDIAVLLAPTAARGARTRRRAELIDGIIATMFVNGGDERRRTSQHNSTLRRVRAIGDEHSRAVNAIIGRPSSMSLIDALNRERDANPNFDRVRTLVSHLGYPHIMDVDEESSSASPPVASTSAAAQANTTNAVAGSSTAATIAAAPSTSAAAPQQVAPPHGNITATGGNVFERTVSEGDVTEMEIHEQCPVCKTMLTTMGESDRELHLARCFGDNENSHSDGERDEEEDDSAACPICDITFEDGLTSAEREAHIDQCCRTGQTKDQFVRFKCKPPAPEGECAFCFEDFVPGVELVRLSCLCLVHFDCTSQWWAKGGKFCITHTETPEPYRMVS